MNYFLEMITNLRQNEVVLLHGKMTDFQIVEDELVVNFLAEAFTNEAIEYPFITPNFNKEAALWAAKTVYIASNLILQREQNDQIIAQIFPKFNAIIDAEAIISADLTLRFMPNLINQLKIIDSEDILLEVLEKIMIEWHYSGIELDLPIEQLNFMEILNNSCLLQLYCNRILHYKNKNLANSSIINTYIKANMGNFSTIFWPDLNN